ncbi:MAG: NUDIX hydrolase [Chloroflexi bacterium]|nr:NUDIX hydrolase [Chloroflexota bacterium]MBV9600773.1 NUDIX hydrolase [Chloroflexota bacterium]
MIDLLELDGPNPWHTQSTRVVFDDGHFVLREDAVTQPDGQPGSYVYLEVRKPVVSVVPVDADGNVYLVRQWRYPWGRNSWEIPGGTCEAGETPLDAAQRELGEEVGVRASDWEPLGTGYSSASVNAHWHTFLAHGLEPIQPGRYQRDGGEHDMVARRVSLAVAVAAAMDGRIAHGMSALGLLRAARRLGI